MKFNLPTDIKKYVTKRRVKILAMFLLTEILLFAVLFFTTGDWRKEDMNNFQFTALMIAVVPFFLFRIPNVIFDKSYKGKIINIRYKEENSVGGMRKKFLIPDYRTFLDIETKKGKLYVIKLEHLNTTGGPNGQIYKIDDKIAHIAGTDFPKILSRYNMEYTTCVVCGSKNHKDSEKCSYCNHSLDIKAEK